MNKPGPLFCSLGFLNKQPAFLNNQKGGLLSIKIRNIIHVPAVNSGMLGLRKKVEIMYPEI